ncbi:MAG: lactate utilization protein [Salaquimonas sp.]
MSRDYILNKIKSQINSDFSDENRRAAVAKRIADHDTGVLPAMPKTKIKQVNRFIEKVKASQATVEQVSRKNLATAIAEYLRGYNLPNEIRMGSDERLNVIRTGGTKSLVIKDGKSDGQDLVGVSHAEGGITETGTLALFSGKENPTTLNFLPENHIVVLSEKDVSNHYEDVWAVIRKRYGAGNMPRSMNFITGPSRSADIEQTLLLGAHGPIRLHVLLTRE